MSFNSKLTVVVNEVEENQVSITEIYSLLDDVNTEIDTKQDALNVLSTITINEVKANSSTINGNIACSTLTLNGSDVETSLTSLSSADVSLQSSIDTKQNIIVDDALSISYVNNLQES